MFKRTVKFLYRKIAPILPDSVNKRVMIIYKIGIALVFVNFIFQRIFRIDSKYPFSKHFTSRVALPQLLRIENDDLSVLVSIAVSGGCYIHAGNGIDIGRGTIIAPNVTIVSLNHDFYDYNKTPADPPIKIGRYCWVGAGSVIRPGTVLGDHTIVGASSLVTNSFPDGYVIIGGVPANIIRRLKKEDFTGEK